MSSRLACVDPEEELGVSRYHWAASKTIIKVILHRADVGAHWLICIGKIWVFQANQTSLCLDPRQN